MLAPTEYSTWFILDTCGVGPVSRRDSRHPAPESHGHR